MIDTSWSKLIDAPIGRIAKTYHTLDDRRKYHNWQHVQRLLWHAQHTFAYEYCPALDLAILFHDSVYDSQPNKEIRSADLCMEVDTIMGSVSPQDRHDACTMIWDTINHKVESDERMICLDLADLGIPEQTAINYKLIVEESVGLYHITPGVFASNSIKFMSHLRDIASTNHDQSSLKSFWQSVIGGIDQTIQMSRDTIDQNSS